MFRKLLGLFFLFLMSVAVFLPDSHAANSALPPSNYTPIVPRSIKAVGGTADVLLIQSALPWESSADTTVLTNLGKTYTVADMSDVPNINLGDYQVVLIVNDQNQSFYDYYKQNYSYFDNYVKNGGTLVFFAVDNGWAGGNNTANLPGNVQVMDRYNDTNIIADATHQIVTRTGTNNASSPLTNSDLNGDYCSHNYFIESTLPAGAKVILRTDDADKYPTLATYPLGKGKVIASGLTWEAAYSWGWAFGRALPDVFNFAFSNSGNYQESVVSIGNIYPEDNWVDDARPITYKHPGDLVDVVVSVSNATGQTVTGATVNFEVPSNVFDTTFSYSEGAFSYSKVVVSKRKSAEEIATTAPQLIDPQSISITDNGSKWLVTVSNQTIDPVSQGNWNDYVFTLLSGLDLMY